MNLLSIGDYIKLGSLSGLAVHESEGWCAFVETKGLVESNQVSSAIWVVDINREEKAFQIKLGEFSKESHPRWSPDAKQLLFLSKQSGTSQLWVWDRATQQSTQLTFLEGDCQGGEWAPNGKKIAFVSEVKAESKQAGKVFTSLLYRFWDRYLDGAYRQVFLLDLNGEGEPKNITPRGVHYAPICEPFVHGKELAFSPDGQSLLLTLPPVDEAWSTHYQIARYDIASESLGVLFGSDGKAHGNPQFSPDGESLAFLRQDIPGAESSFWRPWVVKCRKDGSLGGEPFPIGESLVHSVDAYQWAADSKSLYYRGLTNGRSVVFQLPMTTKKSEALSLLKNGMVHDFHSVNSQWVVHWSALNTPHRIDLIEKSSIQTLSLPVSSFQLSSTEEISVPLSDGNTMQMWFTKPPNYSAEKQWPLLYMIHGGPQAAWCDEWNLRAWNAQLWAARGYIVVRPNPRGSLGFGEAFSREIRRDWAGRCYQDLWEGLELLMKRADVDVSRMGALGASFGGYMMNLFQGRTDLFKALVSFASVYNLESLSGSTEALYFPEYEWGSLFCEENRELMRQHSPHLLAANFQTPMLVVHGERDYRVPFNEAVQLFSALQRKGVPSKLIRIPDEGHWMAKPDNVMLWVNEAFNWFDQYVGAGAR